MVVTLSDVRSKTGNNAFLIFSLGELDFSNNLSDPKGSDEFPVGPARNSTQGCFAHDLHFEDLIDA